MLYEYHCARKWQNWHKCASLRRLRPILVCQHDASSSWVRTVLGAHFTADGVLSRLCGTHACSLKLLLSTPSFSGMRTTDS
jgi:hypothetical protein